MKKQKRPLKERIRILKLRFRNNWLISYIVELWYHRIRLLMFAAAKRKAKRWNRKTRTPGGGKGKTFHVIPTSNYSFTVMGNLQRKAYNRRVAKAMRISYKKLDGISYWNTSMEKKPKTKKA